MGAHQMFALHDDEPLSRSWLSRGERCTSLLLVLRGRVSFETERDIPVTASCTILGLWGMRGDIRPVITALSTSLSSVSRRLRVVASLAIGSM